MYLRVVCFHRASYNLLTLGERARARVHITVHAVTTYIPNVGLSLQYNFHAIRVLSPTSRNSQTTYNRPKPSLSPSPPPPLATNIWSRKSFRGWRQRMQEGKREKKNGSKKKQHWRQSRVREKERKRVKPLKEGKKRKRRL